MTSSKNDSSDAGFIVVSPVGAMVNRDTDTWGKGDPYCVVTINGQSQKTRPNFGGGKTPRWSGHTFKFKAKSKTETVEIKLYDDDTGKDDHIGSGRLILTNLKSEPKDIDVPIEYKKKKIGTCQLKVSYEGAG